MRIIKNPQMQLGEVDISAIKFDPRSRDEIPKLLKGLQYIYCNLEIRQEAFSILRKMIPKKIDINNGRKGMELWTILVLGSLRLNCNLDYDKVHELANNHARLRQMLGHGYMDQNYNYPLQTLKDNISLLTSEILEELNLLVVKQGHKLVKKKEELKSQCDSFVVETNVHFPTDINLLYDAIRKSIQLITFLYVSVGLSGWRQSKYHIKKVKKLFRKAQKIKHSTSKNPDKIAARKKLVIEVHQQYIDLASMLLHKIKHDLKKVSNLEIDTLKEAVKKTEKFIQHTERQIEQIKSRVIDNIKIPHNEKVFSVFQDHTEWICKGKAGISQELGIRVCILKDNFGFILHHQVMQNKTDDKIVIPFIKKGKELFPFLKGCSFDKGFYSPDNKRELAKILDQVTLPKKGKLSGKDKEIEYSDEFVKARKKHSGVEAAISTLENHGLDRCPDHGINGFKRYIAWAVLARNLQILGNIIQIKENKHKKRRKRKHLRA